MFSIYLCEVEDMEHIFRAYDIRGIWGKDLVPRVCLDIGMGLGTFLRRDLGLKKVAVGYDVRTTSVAFHGNLVSGLLSTGIDVHSVGRCGFGVAMFAGYGSDADASCFITASHLEPEWNGLKIYHGDGVGFPEEHIMAIRDRVLAGSFDPVEWRDMGKFETGDGLSPYVNFWKKRYGYQGKGPKIAVDCGGGAMTLNAPHVLKAVGAQLELVNSTPDPFFSSRPSEPKPENLGLLRDTVLEGKLDFGVAFDGDGDRAVVVDDRGEFLSTDILGIVLASSLVSRDGGGTVLANVESSMAIEDVLEPLGARIKRIKVGHTYLTMEAKQLGAVFGVERSGHLIIPEHVLFDDAIVAPLELMKLLSIAEKPLSKLTEDIPRYPSSSLAFQCPDAVKFRVVDEIISMSSQLDGDINTQDGIRIDTDEGWVLIRCSNTSPVIRMTVEARSGASLKALEKEYSGILEETMDRID